VTRALAVQLGIGLVLLSLGVAVTLLPGLERQSRMGERLRGLRRGDAPPVAAPAGETLAGLLRRLGGAVLASGLVGAATLADLQRTVAGAGFRGPRAVSGFVGAKVVLLAALPAAMLPLSSGAPPMLRNLLVAAAAVAGLLAPDFVLRRLRARNRAAVERGLPDALDLMVICAEAGLSLDAAVERVSAEMREANRALSAEFAAAATELRVLSDRRQALLNMGARTGLEALRRLGGTLAQTLQYGTPLTQALRVLAAELRHETLMRFEARAARLPVLLTIPTIVFILPCIFLVVGGPAVLRLLDLAGGQ
jgi:tight adherence protein C